MFFTADSYYFFLLNTKHKIDVVELEKALRAWLDALIGYCVASNIPLEESYNNFGVWTHIVDPYTFEIVPSVSYNLEAFLPFINHYTPDKRPEIVTDLALMILNYAKNYPDSSHHYDFAMINYKLDPDYDKLGMVFSTHDNGGSIFFYMVQLADSIPSLQKIIGIKAISAIEALNQDKHEPNPL